MFQAVIKSERNGPVFQFFIDLGDAGTTLQLLFKILLKDSIFFICSAPLTSYLYSLNTPKILLTQWIIIAFLLPFLSVSYVKRLSIPSGVVGACRLDLAYEHFKV